MDEMITTSDAATILNLTIGRVRQLIYEGKLPAYRLGRDWLINENDLWKVKVYGKPGRPKKET